MSLMDLSKGDKKVLDKVLSNWRLTPATLMHKLSGGTWIPKPWLMYASQRIAYGIMRGGARIIISAPPRHGKSELVSIGTSTWVLENFPNRNVMLTGYGAELMEQFGRKVRDFIWERQDLLTVDVPRDTSKVQGFRTNKNGYMFSIGLGGSMTGRGAHVLLIDDYIKEIKEALSPAYRDYAWNWFTTTAYTRLEPGGSVIIIATRWHSDDLIGRVLTNFPGEWENIVLPAFAEEDDLIGRPVGEPLFPERYDVGALQGIQETLGSVFFQALYQQRPVDEASKIADGAWLRVIDELPQAWDWKLARVWDLASTPEGGDYTTGTHCAYSRALNQFFVTNVVREQLSPADIDRKVRSVAEADGTSTLVCIEQEPGASGKGLVNHFETVVLPEFKVEGVPTTKSKVVRAQPFLAYAEAGKVSMLRGEWNDAFRREFDLFPSGPNDDQVDTVSAGFIRLTGKKVFTASWGRKIPQSKTSSKELRRASFSLGTPRSTISRVTFGR